MPSRPNKAGPATDRPTDPAAPAGAGAATACNTPASSPTASARRRPSASLAARSTVDRIPAHGANNSHMIELQERGGAHSKAPG
eukprot:352058-Chlamydomonas_euryale.AAC.3